MAVFQPSAVSANETMLVTFGESGEVMSVMWPRRHGPKHIREALLGVYADGRMHWTFGPDWERRQSYDTRTRVLTTHLANRGLGLALIVRDVLAPGLPVLVREIGVEVAAGSGQMRLCFASQVQMGGNPTQQGGWLVQPDGPELVYGRFGAIAVGGTPADGAQVNRWGGIDEGSKFNMEQGQFTGSGLVIGRVDCGLSWKIPSADGAIRILLCLGTDDKEALRNLEAARSYRLPEPADESDMGTDRRSYIAERARVLLEELREPSTGCWIAAAEFDPEYLESGGYSYCWPRDAADVLAEAAAQGRHDWVRAFLDWLKRTQEPEGYWHQRYWTDGKIAPSWCLPDTGLQLDEPAAVVAAASEYVLSRPESERGELLRDYGEMISRGARYLISRIDWDTGLHTSAWDLWETFRGSFAYTNAVVARALRAAGKALLTTDMAFAMQCSVAGNMADNSTFARFWTGQYLGRGLDQDGEPDDTMDAAGFGALVNLQFTKFGGEHLPDHLREGVETMERGLQVETPWGPGVARFPNDSYARGAASTVGTLWLVEALLRIAERSGDVEMVDRAERYLAAVEGSATSTGLISEFFGGEKGRWVPGHGWSSALYLRDLRLLAAVRNSITRDAATPEARRALG